MALGLQDSPYFSWFNVLENIVLATPQKNRQRAYTLLKEVGLSEFASYYPQQLSGGMRQRVSIARTLAQNAGYIFLDEPFSALDSKTKQQLKDFLCIEQERREFGLALVLHNIEDAYHFADRILLLSDKEKSLRTIEVLGKSYETIQKEVLDIL